MAASTHSKPAAQRPDFGFILGLLVIASTATVASTDMYAPSLPHLPEYFGTTPEAVKLTMSLNILGFGIAQLFNGPLSDRYGRRPVLILGMAVFSAFSLACALSQSITQLIGARILLGMAASAESVVGYAIIHDVFEEQDRIRALAIFGIMFAAAPALAPIIGGYVHVAFGWRMNFIIVCAIGLLTTLVLWRKLPESTLPNPHALGLRDLRRTYLNFLRNPRFVGYALICSAALGSIFAFITAGPFVLIDRLGVATEHFGYYQGVIIVAYVLGAQCANRLAANTAPHSLLLLGLAATLLGAGTLQMLVLMGFETPASIIAAVSVLCFGLGPLFAVAPALALGEAAGRAGAAAALLGSLEMIVAGTASGTLSVFHDGTSRPLAWVMLSMAVLALTAFAFVRLTVRPKPETSQDAS